MEGNVTVATKAVAIFAMGLVGLAAMMAVAAFMDRDFVIAALIAVPPALFIDSLLG